MLIPDDGEEELNQTREYLPGRFEATVEVPFESSNTVLYSEESLQTNSRHDLPEHTQTKAVHLDDF